MFRDELPGCIGGSAVLLLGDDPDSDSLVVRGDGVVQDVLQCVPLVYGKDGAQLSL